MISFERFVLSNGLKVLVHEDQTTSMAVLNVLYDVGARDEHPDQTGFAHLFEHLMFGGSQNIPIYDEPLQRVGGQNNAFTTNDITNYYISLPAVNLETAFWLESDRMLGLAFSDKSLETQKNVVCEEFKQRYLNQPYGEVSLKLYPLAYRVHPYQWPTIGKAFAHIEQAAMEDVKAFFAKHYHPSNAMMVVAGAVKFDEVKKMTEKWFGDIPQGKKTLRVLPVEPKQTAARKKIIKAKVPLNAIYMAFHMPSRHDDAYHAVELILDILSRGQSSRLFSRLLKEQKLFSDIDAYMTGSLDPGLFIIEGKPFPEVSIEKAEQAIWSELNQLKNELLGDDELKKVKNKIESTIVFAEMSLLEKSMNLAYFELLGDANQLNVEIEKYLKIGATDIQQQAQHIFREENVSTIYYLADTND